MSIYKLFTDGGSRGNPGPSAIGGILYQGKKIISEFSECIGKATNNQAEYKSLIKGLEMAKKKDIKELDCYLDSELVINQMNRRYKIKDVDLAPLFVKVWNLSLNFKKIKYHHVLRSHNKEADYLVNMALDKKF